MSATSTLAALKTQMQPQAMPNVAMSIDTVAGFESMQRIANLFASSDIVPKQYQGNLANCFIAVDMALRMNANPLMVCQNLYIVHGNPAWSAQFLIATFNKSGRFSSLRYEFQGEPGHDDWGCRAVAIEFSTKEKLVGPLITIAMAKKSGWYSKKDKYGNESSKWQTMPEMMLRYRAAAWFVRAYAPEIAMGLQTVEEVRDTIIDITPTENNGVTIEDLQAGPASAQEENEIQESVAKTEPGADPKPEEVPANDKRSADKQRAVKAASRIKAKETAQADLRTMAATPEPAQVEEDYIQCPREGPDGNPTFVTEAECMKCRSRNGCPAWSEEW